MSPEEGREARPPADHRHFGTDHLAEGLGGKAARAGALSVIGQAGQFLVLFVGTVVLARLLTPEDYGLVAMVTAVTAFIARFKDLGLSASTVQRPEINHEQISSLFWINVAFGVVLMIIVSVGAPALVWFYDEPRVKWVTIALASTFVFSGLAAQHHSLLRRQLRFGDVVTIEFFATLLGVGAAITAACYGAEYWSLVLMHALTSLLTMVGVWIRCSWRPGRPVRASGVRSMLSYGGYLTGFNIVNSFLRSFDRILIGWFAAAGPLGLYSRASFLVLIPTVRLSNAATAVAIPVLSRLQHEPQRYRAYVLMATLLFGGVVIPLAFFAFVAADPIVHALLGDEWAGAAPILRALAPVAALATFEMAATWVFISTGHTRRQFAWGIVSTIVTVVAMCIGMQWGVVGVAIGFSIGESLVRIPGLIYCVKHLPMNVAAFLAVLWRPTVAAAGAGATTFALNRTVLAGNGAIVMLMSDLMAFAAAYCMCWLVLPGGRAIVRDLWSLVNALRQ